MDLIINAEYEYDYYVSNENYAAGYTIRIPKVSTHQYCTIFNKNIEKLVKWCNRQQESTVAYVLGTSNKLAYKYLQYAYITILDPLAMKLEKYYKDNSDRRNYILA